jgi:hypothetical protein
MTNDRRIPMQKMSAFLLAITVSLFFLTPALACEPCFRILTLEETAEAADLVIIGRLARKGPSTGDYPQGGPDWIEVQVLETLKGKPKEKRIRVNSWDGMCNYGIILPDKRDYIIFLAEGEELYKAVDIGCAAKQFPIENGMVMLETESVSLDEFVARWGLERGEDSYEDHTPLPLCGTFGFGVVFVGIDWMSKRKN